MPGDNWYYAQAGQRIGPIAKEEIVARISRGQVQRNDLAWTDGMPNWQPAGMIPELFGDAPQAAGGVIPYATPAGYGAGYSPGPDIGQDAGIRMLLPVGRSGWAIAAGYVGLFSVLVLPAPIALILGIIAVRDIRQHPQRHGMGRAIFAIVIGVLGTLALGAMILSAFLR